MNCNHSPSLLRPVRKLYFSLIELLLVLFLLSLAAGFVGLNLYRAVNQERFTSSAQRLVDRLQMAQDLMLLSSADGVGMDSSVVIEEADGVLFCRLTFRGKLPEKRLQIFQEVVRLQGISSIEWDGEQGSNSAEFRFSALEHRFPKGVISLEGTEGSQRWILCQGAPGRFRLSRTAPPFPSSEDEMEGEALYPLEEAIR